MARKKFVTIESSGKILALGGIMGPIKTPSYLDMDIIINLINSGKVVYEVNPANVKEKVRLTRVNVLKHNYEYPLKRSMVNTTKPAVQPVKNMPNTSTHDNKSTDGSVTVDMFVSNKYS